MIAAALDALPALALSAFLVFCRIGGCLMLIPAVGSARVPMRVRLMVALGASFAVSSALGEFEGLREGATKIPYLAGLVLGETGKGLFIGFMARFFFASLQFLAEAAANGIGVSGMGASAEDGESVPAVASLVTIGASALFLITDQHLEVLRALVQSYDVLTFGANLDRTAEMTSIVAAITNASLVTLQVCSPFLVYAVTINFLFGILNRLAPQVPVYFVSGPFITAGGLLLFYFLSTEMLTIFMERFSSWLLSGQAQ
jgi:flagellar biosynthesis protein FliR